MVQALLGWPASLTPTVTGGQSVIASLTLLMLWMDEGNKEIGPWKYGLAALMVMLSFLMMSDLEYPSFKSINWRTRRSPAWVLISIIIVAFSVQNWQWMPSVLFVSYLIYGLVRPRVSRRVRQQIEIEYEAAGTPDDPITSGLSETPEIKDAVLPKDAPSQI